MSERRSKLETEQNGNEKMNVHDCEPNGYSYCRQWMANAVSSMCGTQMR
jgi:hypothetical protein